MHWDLVRQWIGSLGPVVALGAAVVPYRRNSKDRRRGQATHLYCNYSPKFLVVPPGEGLPTGEPDPDGVAAFACIASKHLLPPATYGTALEPNLDGEPAPPVLDCYAERVTVDLSSTSDEPFFNIAVWITDASNHDQPMVSVGQLEPHGKQRFYGYFERGSLPTRSLNVRLEFEDANGRRWQRANTQPVKRLRRFTPNPIDIAEADNVYVVMQPNPDHYSSQARWGFSAPTNEVPGLPIKIRVLGGAPVAGDTEDTL